MMRGANRPVLALGAVLGMAAIVLMLAVLQYHWTGQVSEAAEERMRETLNASTSQFRQEFSRELLRICSGLQLDPAAPPSQIENSVLSRYGDWLSRAAHRNLLAGVYLWRIDGAAPRATRLQATGPKRGGQDGTLHMAIVAVGRCVAGVHAASVHAATTGTTAPPSREPARMRLSGSWGRARSRGSHIGRMEACPGRC
jgi:hypothetical protein